MGSKGKPEKRQVTRSELCEKYFKSNIKRPREEIIEEAIELYGLSYSTVKSIYRNVSDLIISNIIADAAEERQSYKKEEWDKFYKGKPRQKFIFNTDKLFI